MSLRLPEVTELSRNIVRELAGPLRVVAVTATEGSRERAEVLVTIEGCHDEPCRFMVNVTRSERMAFETELRTKLADVLGQHPRD